MLDGNGLSQGDTISRFCNKKRFSKSKSFKEADALINLADDTFAEIVIKEKNFTQA